MNKKLSVYVTERCNLSCAYCANNAVNKKGKHFNPIYLNRIPSSHVFDNISICGGEPGILSLEDMTSLSNHILPITKNITVYTNRIVYKK